MKIALFSIGSLGDVMPFVRLGSHLKRHGHLVAFYGESRFAPLVEDYDLVFSGAIDIKVDPARFLNEGMMNVLLERAVLDEMAERIDATFNGADLIVAHPMVTGFHPLAKAKQWPFVSMFTSPVFIPSIYNPPFDPKHPMASKLASFSPVIAKMFLGITRQKRKIMTQSYLDFAESVGDTSGLVWKDNVFSDHLNIGWFLSKLLPSKKGLPDKPFIFGFNPFDEKKLSKEAQDFINNPRDFILVAMGSNHLPNIKEVITRAFMAAEKLGVRVAVLGANHFAHVAQAFESTPSAFFAMEPVTPLLERARMVVHHGGAGMTSECALFGVPSVIVPLAFDQFKNAHRAKKLGIASIATPDTTDKTILKAWNKPVEQLYDEIFARKFIEDVIEAIERIDEHVD